MNKIRFTTTRLLQTSIVFTAALLGSANAGMKQGALEIWADKGTVQMQAVAAKFTEDTGIPVTVVKQGDAPGMFGIAAGGGEGPDIMLWAHDRYGDWGTGGLIQPLKPSRHILENTLDYAWDAVTVNGDIFAYPIAIEAVSLIYNKALIDQTPASFEAMFELHKSLMSESKVAAIAWDYNNTYFTWPILAAHGARPFAKTAKGYDTSETGANSEGAIYGAQLLKRMIDEGLMEKHIDYSVMDMKFSKGEVAMVISGPWYWDDLDKTGIDFGVVPLPRVNGHHSKAFVGVYGATINGNTPNKDLAVEFIENYLLTQDNLTLYHSSNELGVSANKQLRQVMLKDSRLAATYRSAELGELMPNVNKMGQFWSAMNAALSNITTGRQSPESALNAAAKRIVR
ncbi:maltose/maltodextrin ABC transporter substrate-binding protein MalE [Corallincola luteus]|uniref:Maltodextrin-binding protein n=2 Tax=Corallincola TaxID=1775176 RepID=A0A368NNY9_9GAMM|nr:MULTISPECIES: maltose/maltodextrin ABC transporter substrate-binding protein MalE [Corallincola]RCU51021.1 maltose/maltodextrin ABC transporter substrate-binding protein MalE [Corallincola holothuriorum]TCI04081.1 maltose/maltodextrin ABC transporter substrate-binding protein MalE [Corallincola luteus]